MNIHELIKLAIREDLGDGDHTSLATIPANAQGTAKLLIKEEGIIAGIEIAKRVFKTIDGDITFKQNINDGDHVKAGDTGFEVSGKAISILSAERLALNFMQRMSGIATFTREVVNAVKGTGTKILDTRKTTPNMRIFEKEAVRIGGGFNHRMGLYDMIMIKDNHIDFSGGIGQAIQRTKNYLREKEKSLQIEIEVRDFKELNEVIEAGGVQRILLDNFTPDKIREAVALINGRYETEASGGISLNNVRDYAGAGVDYISLGALTHQIKSLDMSLKALN